MFQLSPRTSTVCLNEIPIGEFLLRILIEVPHIRVRGRAIEVKVIFLYILTVISFAIGQSKKPLFEYRVAPVPNSDGKTQLLLVVAYPGEAVFSPPVGTGASLVMSEILPGVTVSTVIFANRPPLSFAQVGPHFFQGTPVSRASFNRRC